MGPVRPNVEISVVSPVYLAASLVEDFVLAVVSSVGQITDNFEIVLVEDGSGDASWAEIRRLAATDRRVKGVRLSRNFGQHRAITAGLGVATGYFVVVMDCDLQDDPGDIAALYRKAKAGFDIVLTVKSQRAHSRFKNVTARLYGKLFNWLSGSSGVTFRSDVGSFSLLSRKVVDAFLAIRDYHRHYLMVLAWLGFAPAYVEVVHRPRSKGQSSYTFIKLLDHAIDGITSQSNRLLFISIGIGLGFFGLSIIGIVVLISLYFASGFLAGWTSTMVTMLLATGIILMAQGITGIYIGKIFEQSRQRPLYIVSERLNLD